MRRPRRRCGEGVVRGLGGRILGPVAAAEPDRHDRTEASIGFQASASVSGTGWSSATKPAWWDNSQRTGISALPFAANSGHHSAVHFSPLQGPAEQSEGSGSLQEIGRCAILDEQIAQCWSEIASVKADEALAAALRAQAATEFGAAVFREAQAVTS